MPPLLTTTTTTTTTPTLTPTELDDLIYYARTADLPALQTTILSACETHSCQQHPSAVLGAAIDVDADGLGSRSSLLHFPAANGDVGVLEYLLSLLPPETLPVEKNANGTAIIAGGRADKSAPPSSSSSQARLALVNHQNVSGNTPLHWAALNGHLGCVKALVAAGADPSITNAAGHDAVYEAECSGREGGEEVAAWMLANCAGLEKGMGMGSAAERGEEGDGVEDEDELGGTGEDEEEERKEGT